MQNQWQFPRKSPCFPCSDCIICWFTEGCRIVLYGTAWLGSSLHVIQGKGFNDGDCRLSLSIPQAHGIASLGPFFTWSVLPHLSYTCMFSTYWNKNVYLLRCFLLCFLFCRKCLDSYSALVVWFDRTPVYLGPFSRPRESVHSLLMLLGVQMETK